MVQLITNAKGFFNDMTEEVRLFLGQTDILPYAPEAELQLYVILCKDEAMCLAMPQHVEKIVAVQPGADALDVKRVTQFSYQVLHRADRADVGAEKLAEQHDGSNEGDAHHHLKR